MADLTNQYISSSYDDLLQIESNGNVTDGVGVQPGSFVFTNVTASNLNVTSNVNSDLIPGTDDLYDLGSATNAWDNIYGTNISGTFVGDGSALSGIVATVAPAGPNTSVQFKDGSNTSGSSDFTFNKTTGGVTAVSFTGSLQGTASVAISASNADSVNYTNITNKPTLVSGSSQIDYNNISNVPSGIVSSSAQIATDISGSFTAASSSFSTRVTDLETASGSFSTRVTANENASASFSTRVTTLENASASFASDSGSISTRLTAVENTTGGIFTQTGSFYSTTNNVKITGSFYVTGNTSLQIVSASIVSASNYYGYGGNLTGIIADSIDWVDITNIPYLLSSSAQIATEISGAFTADSASISTRLTTLETSGVDNALTASYVEWTDVANKPSGLVSSSAQIASDISGSFTAASSSIASDINTLQTQTIYNNAGSQFSGSFSGSFEGDGSGLTGVVSEWDGSRNGDASITGSLTVSGSLAVVDFINTLEVQGTSFSGSFRGNGESLTFNDNTQQFTGSFSGSFEGDGSGLTNINAANITNVVVNNPTGDATQGISGSLGISGNLTVTGSIVADTVTARQFIVSSSVTNITTQYQSGSSAFGDSIDDTHVFTGSMYVTGSLTVEGSLYATASWAESASWADNATTSSYAAYAVAGNGTFSGSFSGSFYGDGTNITGITASPGGSDTQIQYNNGGIAGGATEFVYDDVNDIVKVTNEIHVSGSTTLSGSNTIIGTTTIKGGAGQSAGIYISDNTSNNVTNPFTNGNNGIFINAYGGTFTTAVNNSVVIGGFRSGEFFTQDNTVYLPYVRAKNDLYVLGNVTGSIFTASLYRGDGSGLFGDATQNATPFSASYALTASLALGFVGGLQAATADGGTTTDAVDLQGGVTASALQLGNIPQYKVPFSDTANGDLGYDNNFTFNEVASTLKVPGLSVTNNASFGDVVTDIVFLNGVIDDAVDNKIEPATDNDLDWGSSTKRWKNVHAVSFTGSSYTGSFVGDGTGLTLSPGQGSYWTGSNGVITRQSDVQITGSLTAHTMSMTTITSLDNSNQIDLNRAGNNVLLITTDAGAQGESGIWLDNNDAQLFTEGYSRFIGFPGLNATKITDQSSVVTQSIIINTDNQAIEITKNTYGGTITGAQTNTTGAGRNAIFINAGGSTFANNVDFSAIIAATNVNATRDNTLYTDNIIVTNEISASAFSGSFFGDGSGITGISSASLSNVVFTNLGDSAVQLVDGTLKLSGNIIAENFIVSSSVYYVTQSFSSGSTIFGNSLDDTHQFTGSVSITGSVLLFDQGTADPFGTARKLYIGEGGPVSRGATLIYGDTNFISPRYPGIMISDVVVGGDVVLSGDVSSQYAPYVSVYGNSVALQSPTASTYVTADLTTVAMGANLGIVVNQTNAYIAPHIIGLATASIGNSSPGAAASQIMTFYNGNIESTGSWYHSGTYTFADGASGSFSGSFVGDGSGLTGIVASQWTASNGAITRESDVQITGSLYTSGSVVEFNLGKGSTSNTYNAIKLYTQNGADVGSTIRGLAPGGSLGSGSIVFSDTNTGQHIALNVGTDSEIQSAVTAGLGIASNNVRCYIYGDDMFVAGHNSVKLKFRNPDINDTHIRLAKTTGIGHYTGSIEDTLTPGDVAIALRDKILLSGSLDVSGSFVDFTKVTNGVSGSFSGSFVGDGSGLTNVTAEWDGTHVGNAQITGSLVVSASGTQAMTVYGSGSTVFEVVGSQGTLWSITDSLSGSLFGVGDISGFQQFEVFSNGDVYMGDESNIQTLHRTAQIISTTAATTQSLVTFNSSSFDGAFIDYTAVSASNARAGSIMAIWNGGSVNYTETTTNDIGSTSGVSLNVEVVGSVIGVRSVTTTAGWNIKATTRAI